MNPQRRHGAWHGTAAARADRLAHHRGAASASAPPLGLRAPHPAAEPASGCTALQLEDLWNRHGTSVYALACALLGDETRAAQAVALGMTDLARSEGSVSTDDARRSWARHVYWRSQELVDQPSGTQDLPLTMLWLDRLARLQRSCLALCLFGGHTRQEAAELLGIPPATVSDLLTAGLREVGRLAAGTREAS